MRVLKCYLANDREGHFVTAGEAMSAPGQIWSCASCGCRLVLHAGTYSDPAWFEHDTRTVARDVLMDCAHLDPEVKAEARHRKLRNMLNGLDATVMTLSWYSLSGREALLPVPDRYLQYRRIELAEKLLL
ncbi:MULTISPECIES: zinc-ribbon domain-containing protein [unclassified Enterobacter cloacae complex]|uniref:zinc-ribbon domain-containing protein n=1 Tax=unclassified Enterobacter cloacae complex TaxID=2757714 RepID=UPI001D0575DB|nr:MULTISPECIES: zinc-ribbon domain-containing protein [unclassified Enterobacter cloacae complex]